LLSRWKSVLKARRPTAGCPRWHSSRYGGYRNKGRRPYETVTKAKKEVEKHKAKRKDKEVSKERPSVGNDARRGRVAVR